MAKRASNPTEEDFSSVKTYFLEILIGEAFLYLIYEKRRSAELIQWPVELLSVMFCHFPLRTVRDAVL